MRFSNYSSRLVAGTVFAVLCVLSSAQMSSAAVVINDRIVPGVPNAIEDTDFERLLNPDGTYDATHTIGVGDILESILVFNTINGENLLSAFGLPYQLSVHARVKVVAFADPDADGFYNMTFAPAFSATEAVRLYENTATTGGAGGTRVNFNTQTVAQSIAAGTSGTLVATFGFAEAGDFWSAINVPLTVTGPFPLTNSYFFGLSMLTNPGGINIDTSPGIIAANPLDPATAAISPSVAFVDIRANGNLITRPVGVTAGWDAQTNTDVQFIGAPEPATFVIWGALIGLVSSLTYYRKRNA
jgi:hypothetical protein